MLFKSDQALKDFLDEQVHKYESPEFIHNDPICIPHLFNKQHDIEIAGLLAALLSWGNRKAIIHKATELMNRMDMSPFDFIKNAGNSEIKALNGFVYRTINQEDIINIILILKYIIEEKKGLQAVFNEETNSLMQGIQNFRNIFESQIPGSRTLKHIANPAKGSAAKRLNMYLRWMVRPADKGVDFGLWRNIKCSELLIPLDVHSGSVARKLGLLIRNADDVKSVFELTKRLKQYDPQDPVKYDFALFGSGINKEI